MQAALDFGPAHHAHSCCQGMAEAITVVNGSGNRLWSISATCLGLATAAAVFCHILLLLAFGAELHGQDAGVSRNCVLVSQHVTVVGVCCCHRFR